MICLDTASGALILTDGIDAACVCANTNIIGIIDDDISNTITVTKAVLPMTKGGKVLS
jgi:hypothetical protein